MVNKTKKKETYHFSCTRDSLVAEADILRVEHPSKDIRFFANNVYNYLKEKEVIMLKPFQVRIVKADRTRITKYFESVGTARQSYKDTELKRGDKKELVCVFDKEVA